MTTSFQRFGIEVKKTRRRENVATLRKLRVGNEIPGLTNATQTVAKYWVVR